MKVLWFEVSAPVGYTNKDAVTLGWQDSLEKIVREEPSIILIILFESAIYSEVKRSNGVLYVPINVHYNIIERKINQFTWRIRIKKVIPKAVGLIKQYSPQIIHIFGNEWPFGLVAKYIDIPVVIHIQGSIIPYNNALYPPGYNGYTIFSSSHYNPKALVSILRYEMNAKSREKMEQEIWKTVYNYMGRTNWDLALTKILHSGSCYYHVEEALRDSFLSEKRVWLSPKGNRIRLLSTGCSSFWKGMDNLLKTAKILKQLGVDFEWNVVGDMSPIRNVIERKEKTTFKENNVNILGFKNSKEITELLLLSTIYVHTAYIENSPNSICEAQYLGVPIISTNVGGISTLIRDGEDGMLLPANDPYQLSNAIIELSKDKIRLEFYSENSKKHAAVRHNPKNIKKQLLDCYNEIIQKK